MALKSRRWSRGICGLAVSALLPLVGCGNSGQSSPGPQEQQSNTGSSVAALSVVQRVQAQFRVKPAAPGPEVIPGPATEPQAALRPSLVDRFVRRGSVVDPVLFESAAAGVTHAATVLLPASAAGAFRITDSDSGMHVDVSMQGMRDVPVEFAEGYAVYRGAHETKSDVLHRVHAEGTEDFIVIERPWPEAHARYWVDLSDKVAGLRMMAGQLEFLDKQGTPRLRMNPPYLVDREGVRHEAQVSVAGCAFDSDPRGPWGRPVTSPGARRCEAVVSWEGQSLAYPAVLDPTWTATGAMGTAVFASPATMLASGRVLFPGGALSSSSATVVSQLYDPGTGTFSATGSMGTARRLHMAERLASGNVIAAGDWTAHTAEVYNPATGTWTATGAMNAARQNGRSAILSNGRVLVTGGSSSATAETYDPATGVFTYTGNMTAARTAHTATVLASNLVLVAGGYGAGAACDLYNPTTGTFTATGSLPTAHAEAMAVRLPSGSVLVAGGPYYADAATFNPSTGVWTAISPMTVGRGYASAVLLSTGRVLLAGGATPGVTKAAEVFDPVTSTFTATASMITARERFVLVLLGNGAVLAAGGGPDSNTATTASELFTLGAQSTTCTASAECAQNLTCADGFCCNTTCANPCDVCALSLGASANGTCTTAPATYASASCGNYMCSGTSTACPTTCATDTNCRTNAYCRVMDHTCQLDQAQGATCTLSSQCVSGFCVDGYCCNSACAGPCDVCSVALGATTNGTCKILASGATPTGSCGQYLCNGASAACPANCAGDVQCVTPSYCRASDSTCQPDQSNAAACTTPSQCVSGNCVDGRCCNTACSAVCMSCALVAGTCSPVTNAEDPLTCTTNKTCDAAGACRLKNGQTCAVTTDCASGNCSDGYCCNSACAGACDVCSLALGSPANGTCGNAPAGYAGLPSCSPVLCGGGSPSCPGGCVDDAGCIASMYCSAAGTCLARKAQGSACDVAAGKDCYVLGCHACDTTLSCVDGFCCNTACGSPCDTCAASLGATANGTCSPASLSYAGSPSCGVYACDGSAITCPLQCDSDAHCAPTHYCDKNHACVLRKTQASACSVLAGVDCLQAGCRVCSTGNCVDSTCCDNACDQSCMSCSGTPGTCTGVKNADDSDTCTGTKTCDANAGCKLKQGQPCTGGDGTQCATGNCVDGFCCDTACSASCDVCSQALGASADGVCTTAPAGYGGVPSCAPALCNGTSASCPGGCVNDSGCSPENYCAAAGQCQARKTQGAPCDVGAGQDCFAVGCRVCGDTLACVDGFCCNGACDQPCDVCSATLGASADGTCSAAPAGFPGSPACGALLCNGAAGTCPSQCGADTDCASGYYCDNSHACVLQKANGSACNPNAGSDCLQASCRVCVSSQCVDGVCCDTACDAACDVCSITLGASMNGTCSPAAKHYAGSPACGAYLCNGTAATCPTQCTDATDCATGNACVKNACQALKDAGGTCTTLAECKSGLFCADGVCCESACTGQCEACNGTANPGKCVAVSGAPKPGHAACEVKAADCVGTCNGTNASSCVYPEGKSCGTPACGQGTATTSACNSQGACAQQQPQQCSPFACGTDKCLAECTADKDCADGFRCESATKKCVPSTGHCIDNATWEGPNKQQKSCAPFICKSAACLSSCSSTGDCASGNVCDTATGACITTAPPAEASEDSGCGCSTPGMGGNSAGALAFLLLIPLRRRRRL